LYEFDERKHLQQEGHNNNLFFVTVCDNGYYGSQCKMICSARHCKLSSGCVFTTGKCDGGCQDGWTGIDCSKTNVTNSGKQITTAPVYEYIINKTSEVLARV
jgi:hypothetical protein